MMRGYSGWKVALGIAAFLGAVSRSAGASPVRIDFDLAGSEIRALGGMLTVPPDGTLSTASLFGVFPSSDSVVPDAGIAVLGVEIGGTVDATVFNSAITGTFDLALGPLAGPYDGMDSFTTAGSSNARVDIDLDCVGALCSAIADFPIFESGFRDIVTPLSFDFENLATPGGGNVAALFVIELSGISVVLDLQGAEISRSVVPEPGTSLLVAAGCVLLALSRRRSLVTARQAL